MGSASSRTGSSAWDTSAQVSVSMGPSRSIRTRRYQSGPSFSKTTSHSRRPISSTMGRTSASTRCAVFPPACFAMLKNLQIKQEKRTLRPTFHSIVYSYYQNIPHIGRICKYFGRKAAPSPVDIRCRMGYTVGQGLIFPFGCRKDTIMQNFEQLLQKYADFIVRVGVNVQPGQTLILSAPLAAAPLARLCAASAFEAGARDVRVDWSDDALTRIRMEKGSEEALCDVKPYVLRSYLDRKSTRLNSSHVSISSAVVCFETKMG